MCTMSPSIDNKLIENRSKRQLINDIESNAMNDLPHASLWRECKVMLKHLHEHTKASDYD